MPGIAQTNATTKGSSGGGGSQVCLLLESEVSAEKLIDLPALTTPLASDLAYLVGDPTGTPTSYQSTIQNLLSASIAIVEIPISTGTTLTNSAFGTCIVCSGTVADYTVGLPTPVGHANEWIAFRMSLALTKLVTLDGGGPTLQGAATQIMWAGETAVYMSDNTNWIRIASQFRSMIAGMSLSTNQTIAGSTMTPIDLDQVDFDNSGFLGDASNNRINIVRPGRLSISGCVTWVPDNTTAVARTLTTLFKTGSQFAGAESYMSSTTYPAAFAATLIDVVAGDTLDLRGYQDAGSSRDVFGSASGRQCQLNVTEINS